MLIDSIVKAHRDDIIIDAELLRQTNPQKIDLNFPGLFKKFEV